jgi:hypothetical protein
VNDIYEARHSKNVAAIKKLRRITRARRAS